MSVDDICLQIFLTLFAHFIPFRYMRFFFLYTTSSILFFIKSYIPSSISLFLSCNAYVATQAGPIPVTGLGGALLSSLSTLLLLAVGLTGLTSSS